MSMNEVLKMNMKKCISRIALASALLLPGVLNAATIILPALDIASMTGDAGATVSANAFNIDATAFTIITDGAPIDISDEIFTLTSTSGSYDASADGGDGLGTFAGTFSVGGGLLSGTFSDLEVFGFGDGINFDFDAILAFDSGSLKGGFTTGVLDGIIGGSKLTVKLATISAVPVPAAVWLFGSGLLGLVGIARRKS